MNTPTLGCFLMLGTMTGLCLAQAPAPAPLLRPIAPPEKPIHYRIPIGWERHIVTVKFRDGLTVRLRDGALTDLGTGALGKAGTALDLLRPGTWSRTHTLAEAELDRLRAIGEQNVGFALHDLNLQFRCHLPVEVSAEACIDALNALDCVEMAESIPGFAPLPQAPDVRHQQGYSEPAPRGTGAGSFQGLPDNNLLANLAACGAHSRIVDIEYGFEAVHADLPPVALLTPGGYSTPEYDKHGTAVLGELGSRNDGYGTTGMAHGAQLLFAHARTLPYTGQPYGDYCVDSSIQVAASSVGAGGVILIEQQIAGARWNGQPTSQFGMLPVEGHGPTRQAIRNAVAIGVVVVEAAGNGSQDLDDPFYGGWFSIPNDSGALLVGAGAAPGGSDAARARLWFSNFGATVDLQGWGEKVTTTGYGDLYAASGPAQYYTQVFSGTSSASPIVAGACALLQSMHWQRRNVYLQPADLRSALRRSGTPQQNGTYPATQNIGPLPDLIRTAVELQLSGFVPVMAFGFGQSLPGNGGNGLDLGASGGDYVHAMAEFDDDGPGPNPTRLYAAGHFARIGGVPASSIACWNGVGWRALGSGIGAGGPGGPYGSVWALAVHDIDGAGPQLPQLYAGGAFSLAGGLGTQNLARWNGTTWSGVGGGCSGNVHSLAVIDEDGPGPLPPSLVVGGEFGNAGALFTNRIARWRADPWNPLGAWSQMGAGFDDLVSALEVYDADDLGPGLPRLVAGGSFQRDGNFVPMRHLAIWDGLVWTELGGGTTFWYDQINALEAVPTATHQQLLVVAGTFQQIGGVQVPSQGLAIWTGNSWIRPNSPAQQPYRMQGFDDGTDLTLPRQRDVYLSCPNGVFRLDLTTLMTLPVPGPGLPANSVAECMLAFDEDGPGVEPPALLFGGNTFAGLAPSAGIAKMFGMTPPSLTGWQTTVPTGCGGPYQPTIAATGMPVLGAPFTVQFECLPQSLPALCVGVPEPVPLPICAGQGSCALGLQPLLITYGSHSATYQFPNDPAYVGIYFGFQGIEFLALPYGPRCSPPNLPIDLRVSDTLVLHF